jgi:hypothetical protein
VHLFAIISQESISVTAFSAAAGYPDTGAITVLVDLTRCESTQGTIRLFLEQSPTDALSDSNYPGFKTSNLARSTITARIKSTNEHKCPFVKKKREHESCQVKLCHDRQANRELALKSDNAVW